MQVVINKELSKLTFFLIAFLLFFSFPPLLSGASAKKLSARKKIFSSAIRKFPKDMRRVDIGAEPPFFDLQLKGKNSAKPLKGTEVYPFVSGNVLYGVNLRDGSSRWRKVINKGAFVYDVNETGGKYVFAIFQDEITRSAKLFVIDRLSGVEVGAFQFWGELNFFHDYQKKFITVKGIDGIYYTFLVLRKGRGFSSIMKIAFDPTEKTFEKSLYLLDYVITSPLTAQKLLQSEWSMKKEVWEYVEIWNVFWAGKDRKTRNNFVGFLSRASGRLHKFPLIDDGDIVNKNYNIRSPVAIFKSGKNLYIFISLNKISFEKEDFIKKKNKKPNTNLVGIYKLPRPYKEMSLSPYKYTSVEGHILFSPGIFKAPGKKDLFYLYYFSALPVEGEKRSGIKNILTLFEPMFWNGQIYVGPQSFSFGGDKEEGYHSSYLGIPSIYSMGKGDKPLKIMFIPSSDVDLFSYREAEGKRVKSWIREYSYNENTTDTGSSSLFFGVSNKPVKKIEDTFLVSSNFRAKNRLYAFNIIPDTKRPSFPYSVQPLWVFEGDTLNSAPLVYDSKISSILSVSKKKLSAIPQEIPKDNTPKKQDYSFVSIPQNKNPDNVSERYSRVVRRGEYLYWVSEGVMFRKKVVSKADVAGTPEKFADLDKYMSTGISFDGDSFAFGTKNSGAQVFSLDKVNYYSFFTPDGRVSSDPVFWNNRVYFATESRNGNYFYCMAMDSENFFLLPNYLWKPEALDKNFSDSKCYRFKIPNGSILAKPVFGSIDGHIVLFAGTTAGKILAIPVAEEVKTNQKGEIDGKDILWTGSLLEDSERLFLPLANDESNKLLFAVSDKGWVSVFSTDKRLKNTPEYRWPLMETNDNGIFQSSGFSVSDGVLAVNVLGKNFHSTFYAFDYFSKKYLRVPISAQLVFEPLFNKNGVYLASKNGKVFFFDLLGIKSGGE